MVDIAGAVDFCRRLPEMMAALEGIYRRVDADMAATAATCLGGGACCRFDLAGHRLYVSTGELALLTQEQPRCGGECRRLRCPYQAGPRCTGRLRRPLGCRIFFCRRGEDESEDGEQTNSSARVYESYHGLIRQLHDDCGARYAYLELTATLRELLLSRKNAGGKAVDTVRPDL